MATLKRIGVLPADLAGPRVHEVKHRLKSEADWTTAAESTVVVGTPFSLSPAAHGVSQPPADLFDLVLMDEAHHSPASTWSALLEAFPTAKKVLCTATPFRLDEQEIRATPIYEYSLQRALDDGIVCPLEYVPVWPEGNEDPDAALARKAEKVLRREREKRGDVQPPLCLLARTSTRRHAEDLAEVYKEHTTLRLRTLHSGHSEQHINNSITKLRAGELDGLLSVNMLAEGFDFPPLKVAAIHRKHKTLPVTLQFVGRFGRVINSKGTVTDEDRAYLLASPDELSGDIRQLYEEEAAWERLIPTLHASRLAKDRELRRQLDTFSAEKRGVGLAEIDAVSLWSLSPMAHVKVFQVSEEISVDITTAVSLDDVDHLAIGGLRVEYCTISRELSAAVFLTRETTTPRWSHLPALDRVEYDLFVVVWHPESRLLFINASRRSSTRLYEAVAERYSGGNHRILPLYKINRVLRDLENLECFNLGMRNRQVSQETESYRILAGRQAERAVAPSDGRLFHRGHVFSRGTANEQPVTLGYSSASKIWSLSHLQVPDLITWCHGLAAKIASSKPVTSGSNLDFLSVGEELENIPEDLIFADWDDGIYQRPAKLKWEEHGKAHEWDILDATWAVDRESRTQRSVEAVLTVHEYTWRVVFSLDEPRLYHAAGDGELPSVSSSQDEASLLQFLWQYPLNFYTSRFSRIQGEEIFHAQENLSPLAPERLQTIDWTGVNITKEFGWLKNKEYRLGGFDPSTIHGKLAQVLRQEDYAVVIYDHGSGELADFIAITDVDGAREIVVRLYHVKAAGGNEPGNRVGDAYEVCGQVVKSLIWVKKPEELAEHLERRCKNTSFFVQGGLASLRRLLGDRTLSVRFNVGLVQPGFTQSEVQPKILEILAAADDYVRRSVGESIFVIASP